MAGGGQPRSTSTTTDGDARDRRRPAVATATRPTTCAAQRRGARRGAAARLRGADPRAPPGGDLVGELLVRERLAAGAAAVRAAAGRRGRLARRSQAPARPTPRSASRRCRELAPHAVAVEAAGLGLPRQMASRRSTPTPCSNARASTRRLDTSWRRTSYTASDRGCARCARRLRAGAAPACSTSPRARLPPRPPQLPLSAMASGPRLGTLIHETLAARRVRRARSDPRL